MANYGAATGSDMSQLSLLALILLAGWLFWRRYSEASRKIDREIRDKQARKIKGMKLERDPKTGIYRPQDESD